MLELLNQLDGFEPKQNIKVTYQLKLIFKIQPEMIYYRIMAVLKVETDIIANITVSPREQAVIMYVEIFKTGVIVFIDDVTRTDHFQYQSQFLCMRVTN